MAPLPGMRGTGDFTVDFRPTNYRELYTFLEPNGDAPLNAIVSMLASESTDDPKFNNFRDELPVRSMVYASISSSTITVATAADAGWVTTGTLLLNANTGELLRATSDGNTSAGTFNVTRNVGGGSLTLTANDVLYVVGSAEDEGDTSPTSVTFDPTTDYNYCQIFKKPFKITGSTKETYFRTGPKEDEYKVKALKLHMSDLERSMFFSKRSETTGANGQKLRTTGGLIQMIGSAGNTTDAASAFAAANVVTENEFDRWLINTVFAYGSNTKIAFVGADIAGHMLEFGKDRWQPSQVDDTYGISFTRYKTPAGTLMVQLHPQFRQLAHMSNAMMILDTDYLKYRYMQNRDTSLQLNIQANDEDAVKHQYMTDCGLELLQAQVHHYLINWNATSA